MRPSSSPAIALSAAASVSIAACGLGACNRSVPGEEPLDVYVPEAVEAGTDGAPAVEEGPTLIDRAGHPLVAVLLVPGQLDDSYNASFGPDLPRTLQDAIEARLVELDTLTLGDAGPDPVDWPIPEGGAHPLLPAFVEDALLVDTGRSCSDADGGYVRSYFDLDREAYLGAPLHATCGGRTPGEDVVSETFNLLVKGPGGPDAGQRSVSQDVPVSQGVSPTKPPPMSFPYLAPPN